MSDQTFINKEGKEVVRQVCDRYSRVVGYLSPLRRWNDGKQSEWADRKTFKV